jgi:hypothetical protein
MIWYLLAIRYASFLWDVFVEKQQILRYNNGVDFDVGVKLHG